MRNLSVGAWDPAEQIVELSDSVLAELLAAADCLDEESFGLSVAQVSRLAATVRLRPEAWRPAAALDDQQVIRLVRLYTLAEGRFPEWKAGSASPVIALCRLLRRRGAWPADLTAWIKAHSDNKFLPYGSLADRL
ncbi:MAG: hypothetical protein F4X81_19010 [Gammaproteobacteria bacterium]|nr:hypothetical protein [Gammaproteobacteria bacterium]MXY05505.1 hypothetical protein [Gammaproteobacteria bacterium]MYE53548.1 hypothetical protein [Gammaproteobacteria bacterium]MYF10388.1 hypothetical protein [Gammaproteobacteria bacterium]MYG11781.1 hypothetical protein [Gammaproteobacteria bacterium]